MNCTAEGCETNVGAEESRMIRSDVNFCRYCRDITNVRKKKQVGLD